MIYCENFHKTIKMLKGGAYEKDFGIFKALDYDNTIEINGVIWIKDMEK